ncbi:MAG: hypothetical protein RL491_1058 [Bacteroidota bacterium]
MDTTQSNSTPKKDSFFQQFKRFLQMRAPEKHDEFMWRQLRKAMDELDYNYMANDKNRSMQLNFGDEILNMRCLYYADNGHLTFRGRIAQELPEERMADVMILVSHLNNVIGPNRLYIDVKSRDLEIVLRVPYLEAIWNPQAIKEACYWQIHMHEKCQLAMEYMIESGEDPVFVFGYIMNADKDK